MDRIVFVDPETNEEFEFQVEEETEVNGTKYLMVSDAEDSAFILKEIRTEDEEVLYEEVEDDVEFNALVKVFAELLDEETSLDY
ncbi:MULTISPECIES: DUF1292 domain-containing protein [Agathobacter]|uniref:DUF1292 domain-containing protein n=1 Tax=Agathobacter ruminis TaxID=1712665 RepID=A0A2G3E673_9FIRM|nr:MULTISPECIES: DUF1292 domain-containing protein [Agathobacter]MCR5678414.1 DUF1292 domain-containing protein [Agathobacter sp.]MDC7301507.1 DUF1292 domain-containing protein [Agathobacter ruminis]PHU38782.1 DUF1292 domain-containing protein [Agathobacter ruminis]